MAHPRKPPYRHKNIAEMPYASQVTTIQPVILTVYPLKPPHKQVIALCVTSMFCNLAAGLISGHDDSCAPLVG